MIQAEHDLMPVVPILLLTGMAGSSLLFILRWPGNRRTHQHQDHQPVFQAEFDSIPSPNTHIVLPFGITLLGVENWVTKLADVA